MEVGGEGGEEVVVEEDFSTFKFLECAVWGGAGD